MSYRVVIAHEAEKILDRLDRPTEQRIRTRIIQLSEDPFDPRLSAPLTERPGIPNREWAAQARKGRPGRARYVCFRAGPGLSGATRFARNRNRSRRPMCTRRQSAVLAPSHFSERTQE